MCNCTLLWHSLEIWNLVIRQLEKLQLECSGFNIDLEADRMWQTVYPDNKSVVIRF